MYIFGIFLLLMELMFIVLIILVFVVIWNTWELSNLRSLILIEKEDIYRFEKNLDSLAPKEKKEHIKNLEGYIKSARNKGYRKSVIRDVLMHKGWPKQLVDDTLSGF